MNIIIEGSNLSNIKAGIGNYTYNLLNYLLKIQEDINSTVLLRPDIKQLNLGERIQTIKAKGVYTKYLPYDAENLSGKYDLLHEPSYIPRIFRGKTVATVCDMSYRLFPQYHPRRRVALFRLFEHRMCRANKIITISQNSKKEIIELLGIPEEKIAVTYLGASAEFKPMMIYKEQIRLLRAKYNLPETFILYVGTIEPRKNLERLIGAFSVMKQQGVYKDVKLVLAGGKGWLYEQVFKSVQENRLEEEVLFTGYVQEDDLPALYNMAMIFVYPSIYEGFGLPPLEAMSCGIPVVSTNTSSIPEVVADAGILVNPYDIVELSEVMKKLLDSKTLRDELSKKGLARATTFSWAKCAQETFQIYKDCITE
ncbi:MAG: glycosyltransferase family 4 protein [Bacillota bacterium]